MSDVFISYSRLDKDFVGKLREALLTVEQDVWIDWEDIPPSQAWWDEIKKGIVRANNFVVVLSPYSMASPVCQMEIEYARQIKKRIIPVLYQDYEREAVLIEITKRLARKEEYTTREIWGSRQAYDIYDANDGELKHINHFFFRAEDDFQTKFDDLFTIIRTDYAHKEQHTTLELRALEWDRRGRDASFLLLDTELAQAQAWLTQSAGKEPTPTDLQREYIQASEKRTRQLRNIRRASVLGSFAAVVAIVFAVGASLLGLQAANSADQASTQIADSNSALTAVPPTLTRVNQQVIAAQQQANLAGTQIVDANNALTAVPPTLTQVNGQVATAQGQANRASTQIANANSALTAVPPILTQVNQQVITAQGQADLANTQVAGVQPTLAAGGTRVAGVQPTLAAANSTLAVAGTEVANANSALTAVPPTLTQVNGQVATAQGQANLAGTQVAQANGALTAVPPTLTQAANSLSGAVNQFATAEGAIAQINATSTSVFGTQIAQVDRAQHEVANANATLTRIPATLAQLTPLAITVEAVGTEVVLQQQIAATARTELDTIQIEIQLTTADIIRLLVGDLGGQIDEETFTTIYEIESKLRELSPGYCPQTSTQFAQNVLGQIDSICGGVARNQMCHAGGIIDLTYWDEVENAPAEFMPGDVLNLNMVQAARIRPAYSGSPDDLGVLILSMQPLPQSLPNLLPGQNVTIILIGGFQDAPMVPILVSTGIGAAQLELAGCYGDSSYTFYDPETEENVEVRFLFDGITFERLQP